jgi:hypothetical protein
MFQLYKFRLTFIKIILVTTTITLFLMLVVIIDDKFSYSQKVVLPTSNHIQNHSVIILPSAEKEIKKTYISKYEYHNVLPSISKSIQINNTLSFTIVNATITIMDKILDGITKGDYAVPHQYSATPLKKILRGNI